MLNRSSAYALEAVLVIARSEEGELVRAAELAEHLDLPPNYLAKILNALVHAGILASERGPAGGFRLAILPEHLAIEDIVGPFEDVGASRRCLLGRGECNDRKACPLHADWKKVSRPMFDFFHTTSIADLLARDRGPKRRTFSRPTSGGRKPRSGGSSRKR